MNRKKSSLQMFVIYNIQEGLKSQQRITKTKLNIKM